MLNWHSTCKHFWDEYVNMDDDKLLEFAAEKRKKNEQLLKKFLQVQYRHNILAFTDFEMILQICQVFKEKIISLVDTKFYESNNSDPSTEIYCMAKWEKWRGMKFDAEDNLSKHSMELLRAASPRLIIRYGWQIIFNNREDEPTDSMQIALLPSMPKKKSTRLLFYPWDTASIKPKAVCYIGDCSNLSMEKFFNFKLQC